MTYFFVSFAFLTHYRHLLSEYKILLLIQTIFMTFTHTSSVITPKTFLFFPFGSGHNLICQTLFHYLLQCLSKYHLFLYIQLNCIHITQLCFFIIFMVLHNHTKSHTLPFHLILILRNLNGWVYCIIICTFLISIANILLDRKKIHLINL